AVTIVSFARGPTSGSRGIRRTIRNNSVLFRYAECQAGALLWRAVGRTAGSAAVNRNGQGPSGNWPELLDTQPGDSQEIAPTGNCGRSGGEVVTLGNSLSMHN